jgi:hypothetical protein
VKGFLGWDVVGWFLVMGVGVFSVNEPRFAKCCFVLSTVIVWGKVFMWGISTSEPFGIRAVATFVAFGIVGLLLIESFRWVDRKSGHPTVAPTAAPTSGDSGTVSKAPREASRTPRAVEQHKPPAHIEQYSSGGNSPNVATGDNSKIEINNK